MSDTRPIGVFDSGLGGLTVLRALHRRLPAEDLVYFGDTARVPYGTKGEKTVRGFARQDAGFLVRQGVKMVVVACNTASAFALDHLRDVVRPGDLVVTLGAGSVNRLCDPLLEALA